MVLYSQCLRLKKRCMIVPSAFSQTYTTLSDPLRDLNIVQPWPPFHLCFQTNNTILTTNQCEKCPNVHPPGLEPMTF